MLQIMTEQAHGEAVLKLMLGLYSIIKSTAASLERLERHNINKQNSNNTLTYDAQKYICRTFVCRLQMNCTFLCTYQHQQQKYIFI